MSRFILTFCGNHLIIFCLLCIFFSIDGSKRIGTLGGAVCDIFITCPVVTSNQDLHSYLMFEEGTKIEVTHLNYVVGGGAANAAYALARLGLDVAAFFKTGVDHAATFIRNDLSEHGVDVSYALCDQDISTGTSFILPSEKGNHTILVFRGANTAVGRKEFPLSFLDDLEGLYITPLTGSFLQLLPFLVKQAHSKNILVMHNPSKNSILYHSDILFEALSDIDILMFNYSEAELLAKKVQKDSIGLDLLSFCKILSSYGPRMLIITNGDQGVYCFNEGRLLHCCAHKIEVCNTVGAGDTFGATFFGALLHGYSLKNSLILGCFNSASVLSNHQPHAGLLSFSDLEERLQIFLDDMKGLCKEPVKQLPYLT